LYINIIYCIIIQKPTREVFVKVIIDKIMRQKLLVIKNEHRAFVLESPADADIGELYGVVSKIKEELWNAMENKNKKEIPIVIEENVNKKETKDPQAEA
jgi:hypothetical protein